MSTFTPRPYQSETVEAVKTDFFEGYNNLIVQLPTGTGKTEVFSMLPSAMDINKRRMMVMVHRDELVQQAYAKMGKRNPGYTIGIEKAEQRSGDAQLVVASVQTLSRSAGRLEQFRPEDFAILVTDEAHHAVSNSYRKVYDYFRTKERKDILNLGVTATVNRADGKGLGEIYSKISYEMSILDAIRQGWLSDLRGIRVRTGISLDAVHKHGGDFDLKQLSETINVDKRNEIIAHAYIKYGEQRKFIGFADDIAHAQSLASTFKKYGYSVEAVWGSDPNRAEKLALHRKGTLLGLFNCELLTEGYDDWSIQAIIMARPTQSSSLYTQMLGRGTRIPEGVANLADALKAGEAVAKKDCLVMDVVDSTKRHTLSTLPTLFGLGQETNLAGKSLLSVMPKIEQIKATKPEVKLEHLDDITNLDTFVEEVDLFKVDTPPEVLQLSEYRWFRTDKGNYCLKLAGGEHIFAIEDILGKWSLHGKVKDYLVDGVFGTLEAAIKKADYKVAMNGGKMYQNMAKRHWKTGNKPPSEKLLSLAKRLHLKVPPGTTKEALVNAIDKRFAELRWKRNNQGKVA